MLGLLATAVPASPSALPPGGVEKAWGILGILVLIAMVGLALAMCTMLLVRRRGRPAIAKRRRRRALEIDPWAEAGRRVEPADDQTRSGEP